MQTRASTPEPSRAVLLSLGSTDLSRPRIRLPDDSVSVRICELGEGDEARLQHVYAFVLGIHDALLPRVAEPRPGGDADALEHLAALVQQQDFRSAHRAASELGLGVRRRELAPRVRKAYHDLRGGSLLSLLMHLEMVELGHATEEDVTRIFILARDQLKIMRNAVPDLDAQRYWADLQAKDHAVSLLREKWSTAAYRLPEGGISVDLDCDFDGVIASCCIEFSTLDRVIYNLVNNAAQHSSDGAVSLSVLPIDDDAQTLLRIVVSNRIDSEHKRVLEQRFGDDLAQLYRGGFSTSHDGHGHGLGLRICGDLVTHGFSLPSVPFAVDHGYLGATLLDDRFIAWFHWPARRATATTPS